MATIRADKRIIVEDPMTDFESWMPDFMEGLAQEIEKSRTLVKDAVDNVAGDMVLTPGLAMVDGAGASGISGGAGWDGVVKN